MLELLFIAYLASYAMIVLANCLYWLLMRQKPALVCYALASGCYLLFLGLAYVVPSIEDCLTLYNVPIMIMILAIDFHNTLKWREIDVKKLFPQMDDDLVGIVRKYSVVEWAKAVPVVISAPLYVVGMILLIDIIKARLMESGY
jgi:hypothetical protein